MKEGQSVNILINSKKEKGEIIKLYTKIGSKDHRKRFAIILFDNIYLKLHEIEVGLLNKN